MPSHYDLDEQLCFALYAAARATQAMYRPLLTELDLTYPQYLVLLALWQEDAQTVSALGKRLYLDSGTLSPLLRRMEQRGVLARSRKGKDGRQVVVTLTEAGQELRAQAGEIQRCLATTSGLSPEEFTTLRDLAHRVVQATTITQE